jgi:membrane protein YdbS with pleckstrin-like domain
VVDGEEPNRSMEVQPTRAEGAERERRTTNGPKSIHPAIKKVWLFSGILTVFLLGLAVIVPAASVLFILRRGGAEASTLIAGVSGLGILWIVIFVLAISRVKKQWQNWTYEVREHDVILSWGVYWRTRRHVARDRIQHLDINSGPLDRRFGLVQVGVHTAGAAGTVGVIPGLTPEEAEDLRDMILESQADHV